MASILVTLAPFNINFSVKIVPKALVFQDHSYCRQPHLEAVIRNHPRLLRYNKSLPQTYTCSDKLASYACIKCKFKTDYIMLLKQHIWNMHNLSPLDKKKQTSSNNVQFEVRIFWYYCKQCSYKTINVKSLRSHQAVKHPWNKKSVLPTRHTIKLTPSIHVLKCNYCNYTCTQMQMLQLHKDKEHVANGKARLRQCLRCVQCSFKTFDNQCMRFHIEDQHP